MKWFSSWEKAMAAAAYAEAGEPEMVREFLGVDKSRRRKVLLGVNDCRFTPRLLEQALNVCRRVGAGLEVLHLLPQGDEKSNFSRELKDGGAQFARLREWLNTGRILYELVVGGASLSEEVVRYAAGRRDLVLILMDHAGCGEDEISEPDQRLLQRLPCPLTLLRES